jgi:ribosomal protein L40E
MSFETGGIFLCSECGARLAEGQECQPCTLKAVRAQLERTRNLAMGMFWCGGNFDDKTVGELVALGLDSKTRVEALSRELNELRRPNRLDYDPAALTSGTAPDPGAGGSAEAAQLLEALIKWGNEWGGMGSSEAWRKFNAIVYRHCAHDWDYGTKLCRKCGRDALRLKINPLTGKVSEF